VRQNLGRELLPIGIELVFGLEQNDDRALDLNVLVLEVRAEVVWAVADRERYLVDSEGAQLAEALLLTATLTVDAEERRGPEASRDHGCADSARTTL
jgi:hypothetical protein